MKVEIYASGPISCGIMSTSKLSNYKGGVFTEFSSKVKLNHEVSIVGWGVSDDKTEYWIGRNNWGTYWGENEFFRIRMNIMNLGVNKNCTWGIPIINEEEYIKYLLNSEIKGLTIYF